MVIKKRRIFLVATFLIIAAIAVVLICVDILQGDRKLNMMAH